MSAPSRLAAALIGLALLISGTACGGSPLSTRGNTVKSSNNQMPALPENPDAAEAVVRAIVMKEAIVLLKASGLKYTYAQFMVQTAFDDEHAQAGDLLIEFKPCTGQQAQAMTAAIEANGWGDSGISIHSVNVNKGPIHLLWGLGVDGGELTMTTVNISQYLPGIKDRTQVPELAAFKALG
jgi:hypothetical protein